MFKKEKSRINLAEQVGIRIDNKANVNLQLQMARKEEKLIEIVTTMGNAVRCCHIPGGIWNSRYKVIVDELLREAIKAAEISDREEREAYAENIKELLFWFGPLWQLIEDQFTVIEVCDYENIFFHNGSEFIKWDRKFINETQLHALVIWIAALSGQRVDEKSVLLEGTIKGFGHFTALFPPMAQNGIQLELFMEVKGIYSADYLIQNQFMDQNIYQFLKISQELRLNTLIIGEAGAGKTTLINLLAGCVKDAGVPIVAVEQEYPLFKNYPLVKHIGAGTYSENQRLFKQLTKIKPQYLYFDGISDATIIDFLYTAGEIGGCVASMNCRELRNLDECIQFTARISDKNSISASLFHSLINRLDLIIQVNTHYDGVRRISRIAEVVKGPVNPEQKYALLSFSDKVYLRDIFVWNMDKGGSYRHLATGHVPEALSKFLPDSKLIVDNDAFRGSASYSSDTIFMRSGDGRQ